ncbi:hypothetical protein [Larkinella punicea]|uniref:hypothetical protein n=1 Tax=Larkinella punicea TaxID=2315727 RepID=UPI0035B68756
MYLVVLDGYRVLKYIFPHADPKKVVLVSQNKTYPDWEVNKEDILHLFLVKGYWNQTAN